MIIRDHSILRLLTIIDEGFAMTKKRAVYPIHPGAVLNDELAELGLSPAEVARHLHVPPNRLYQLIAGKRAMTADTALRLQQWLGVSAGFWMNLQKRYELDVAAVETGAEIVRTIRPRKAQRASTVRENLAA
jgi:addiction module HigA family antidote